jgi:hypothetical protein
MQKETNTMKLRSRNYIFCGGILLFVIFIYFSAVAVATTIDSHFACSNTNGETTFYSYLKEPKLQDSGYSKGLKTGSFNYFRGGPVTLDDTTYYYDGESDEDHSPDSGDTNSSARHNLYVKFDGQDANTARGISEFYAKGFYTNNRAVSAWKKIWFVDSSSMGLFYPSNSMEVKAKANLNMAGLFNLKYNATAQNAFVVFTDAAGWSNRTGSRRIDWQQSGLLKGDAVNITNDLRVVSNFKPRAGGKEDWLPCCLQSGTLPPIEPIEGEGRYWTRQSPPAVLWPPQRLPTAVCSPYGCTPPVCNGNICDKNLIKIGKVDRISTTPDLRVQAAQISSPQTSPEIPLAKVEAIDCNPKCGGPISLVQPCFTCIYTTGQEVQLPDVQGVIQGTGRPELPPVQVEGFFSLRDKFIDYIINVRNLGDVSVDEVLVMAELGADMIPLISSSTVNDEPVIIRQDQQKLYWDLGTLRPVTGPEGIKIIKFTVEVNTDSSDSADANQGEAVDISAFYKVEGIEKKTATVHPQEIIAGYTEDGF